MKYVIVDIDGVICNLEHRLHLLEKDELDSFFEYCKYDEPVEVVCDLLKVIMNQYQIVFCTSRLEKMRESTSNWIGEYISPHLTYDKNLLMRKNDDMREDIIVKPELLKEAGINRDDIAFIFEDRLRMVEAWRNLGIPCFWVADETNLNYDFVKKVNLGV
jgi:hypothetical protein